MYKLICVSTCFIKAKSQLHQELNPGSLAWSPSILTPLLEALMPGDTKYVYYIHFTWRLVTYVRRRTSRPPSPRHHVAGPSLDIDLLKAEIGGEAGLGTADVAEHC